MFEGEGASGPLLPFEAPWVRWFTHQAGAVTEMFPEWARRLPDLQYEHLALQFCRTREGTLQNLGVQYPRSEVKPRRACAGKWLGF